MRVNFSEQGAKNHRLKFIVALTRIFAQDNDIKFEIPFKNYIGTPQGSKALAAWASSQGYKITYWCMPSYKYIDYNGGKCRVMDIWPGFGIDIDETCPLIIKLKLQNS